MSKLPEMVVDRSPLSKESIKRHMKHIVRFKGGCELPSSYCTTGACIIKREHGQCLYTRPHALEFAKKWLKDNDNTGTCESIW